LVGGVLDRRPQELGGFSLSKAAVEDPSPLTYGIQEGAGDVVVFAVSFGVEAAQHEEPATRGHTCDRTPVRTPYHHTGHGSTVPILVCRPRIHTQEVPPTNPHRLVGEVVPNHIVYEPVSVVVLAIQVEGV